MTVGLMMLLQELPMLKDEDTGLITRFSLAVIYCRASQYCFHLLYRASQFGIYMEFKFCDGSVVLFKLKL